MFGYNNSHISPLIMSAPVTYYSDVVEKFLSVGILTILSVIISQNTSQ